MSPPHDDLNGLFVVGVIVNTGVVGGKVVELECCVADVVVIACFVGFVVVIRVVVGFFVGVGNKAKNQNYLISLLIHVKNTLVSKIICNWNANFSLKQKIKLHL